jgi:hypothetical protein
LPPSKPAPYKVLPDKVSGPDGRKPSPFVSLEETGALKRWSRPKAEPLVLIINSVP